MIKVGTILNITGTSTSWPRIGTKNKQLSFLALVNYSPELYSPSEMLLFLNNILKKINVSMSGTLPLIKKSSSYPLVL